MKRRLPIALTATFSLLTASCKTTGGPPIRDLDSVPGAAQNVRSLAQGWSAELEQEFWFTTQGSEIVPYDWFLHLERANDDTPFRADSNINRFRYLPSAPSKLNPDGLPIGFVKTVDPKNPISTSYMGFTCAACHTGQVNFKGTGLRVNGAPALADFTTFYRELIDALVATQMNAAKFDRFARKVLGEKYNEGTANTLHAQVLAQTEQMLQRQALNASSLEYGYARLDAFGDILNVVTVATLNLPENKRESNAPVSYPFLWDTPQHDVVQWNGSAANAGPGPLLRNVGEMYGVFGRINVSGNPVRYDTSIDISKQGLLEMWLKTLQSPLWPQEVLGPIDPVLAEKGRVHYQKHCSSCHADINRADPNRRVKAVMTTIGAEHPEPNGSVGPKPYVNTDWMMAQNFATRQAKTGILQGSKTFVIAGDVLGEKASGLDVLLNQVVGASLAKPFQSIEAGLEDYVKVSDSTNTYQMVYKARPLNGIWATAPYLHNGSVPNLWELLLPAEQRSRSFLVGSREMDTRCVGYASYSPDAKAAGTGPAAQCQVYMDEGPEGQSAPKGFVFDTTKVGNLNQGHEYGARELDDAQKWELIEYMKSI